MNDDDRTTVEQTPPTEALPEQTAPTTALVVEPTQPASVQSVESVESVQSVESVPRPAPVATAVPSAQADQPEPRMLRGIRMRTVVLGLVLLAISATSLLRVLTDVRIDDSLVLLILLVVAGALLLGAGVASAAREARSGRSRD
jgi:hypothetical protein